MPDSVEAGLDGSNLDPDTDLAVGCFFPDFDAGSTVTDRLEADTDGGGDSDGLEDINRNGRLDPGEKNPLYPGDDPCAWSPAPEVLDVRAERLGADLRLTWNDLLSADPCVEYRVLGATGALPFGAPNFVDVATGLVVTEFTHAAAANDGSIRFYLLRGGNPFAGDGALGHFGD